MHWPVIESQQPAQFAAEHAGGGVAVQRRFEQNGVVPEHAEQMAPPEPHADALVPLAQVPVERSMQPGQAAHAPAWHVWVAGHAVQAAPFAPHCAVVGVV